MDIEVLYESLFLLTGILIMAVVRHFGVTLGQMLYQFVQNSVIFCYVIFFLIFIKFDTIVSVGMTTAWELG
jgi:hypothetical protein